jgi:DNA-binding NarL/FixJ family response regulator
MKKIIGKNMELKKVFIADDHASVRKEFIKMIENNSRFEVVGEADDGDNALVRIRECNPDIIILDISMPGKTGLEVARELNQENNRAKIVFLTFYSDQELVDEATSLGTSGYVLKETASEYLHTALESVAKGSTFFSPNLIKREGEV